MQKENLKSLRLRFMKLDDKIYHHRVGINKWGNVYYFVQVKFTPSHQQRGEISCEASTEYRCLKKVLAELKKLGIE